MILDLQQCTFLVRDSSEIDCHKARGVRPEKYFANRTRNDIHTVLEYSVLQSLTEKSEHTVQKLTFGSLVSESDYFRAYRL